MEKKQPIKLQVNGRPTTIKLMPSAKQQAMDSIREGLALLMELVCGMVVIMASVVALWAWVS